MRVGIYVSHVAVRPGYENIVSGHVQIPLRTADLLRAAGHDVHLITTRRLPGRVWPTCLPEGLAIHELDDPSRQGSQIIAEAGRRSGVRPFHLIRWLFELRRLAQAFNLDVLHFFGANRTAHLAGLYRMMGGRTPVLVTISMNGFPEAYFPPTRPLWRRVDRVLTTTEHLQQVLEGYCIPAAVLRHGVVRNIADEVRDAGVRSRHRVLFWREATVRNGGDIALEVFRVLAPKYPQIQFDFAIRPHWEQVPGLTELAAAQPNVSVHIAPYPPGISLAGLLAESVCVLQPFRSYTYQPQLSILESMAVGVPVIASNIESSRELIQSGENGIIVAPGDSAATTQAVEMLLRDTALAGRMGERAAGSVLENWTWRGYIEQLLLEYGMVVADTGI